MLLTDSATSPGDRQRPPGPRVAIRIVGLAVALATAVGVLAAAGGSASAPPAAVRLGPHPTPPLYPLLYGWSAAGARIAAAQQRLVAACMARRGFRYAAPPVAGPAELAGEAPTPFGLESLDPPAAPGRAAPSEPPTPGYAAALLGDPHRRVTARVGGMTVTAPATGCIAEAETRLQGAGRVRWLQLRILLYHAEQAAMRALDTDPAFRALNARWRTCMRPTGYDPPNPAQLRHAVPAGHDLRADPVLQADLRCKADTDYLPVGYGRLAALQRRQLAADPSLLRDWTALRARQAAAAAAVLRHGG